MKIPTFFAILTLAGRAALAADVSLSIEPDPYVSSDHATICRVFARNDSFHTLDGRAVGFEAEARENGVVVMREKGRFAGAIAPGETAETRIGFNGVFTDVRVVAAEGKIPSRSRRGKSSKAPTKTRKKGAKRSR